MECTHTFEVAAAPAAVWALVADPTRWPEWMGTVTTVKPKKGTTEPEHGALYSLRRKGDFAGDLRIASLRPLEEVTYVLSGTSAPASGSFRLESGQDGRTTVTSALEFGTVTGVMLGLSGQGEKRVEDQLISDAVGLRRLLEAAPEPV